MIVVQQREAQGDAQQIQKTAAAHEDMANLDNQLKKQIEKERKVKIN